ncbi:MAG TPA: hypothetical protein VKD22_06040 [Ramlibacter sp.]|nr:hypothetical protein [Ramlibacter sp.]
MPPDQPVPRILQPQPERESDPQQQPSGASERQPGPDAQPGKQQMGEGSYEATRDYQKNIGEYLKKADVEKDAEAAKPHSQEEAREMNEAEQEGKSHAKGER